MSPLRRSARELLDEARRAENGDELDRALELYADAAIAARDDPAVVTEALTRQAGVFRRRSEWDLSVTYARRARTLAEDAELPYHHAEALAAEGNALMCRGSFDEALSTYELLLRSAEEPRQRGIALQNMGSIFAQRGRPLDAMKAFRESRALFAEAEYPRGEAIAANNVGHVALDVGDLDTADRWLTHALARAQEVEDAELVALVSLNLAQLQLRRDALDDAEDRTVTALGHFQRSQNRWRQIECWRVLGDIAAARRDRPHARELYERALRLSRSIDASRESEMLEERLARL